jgi:hypothetical protein
MKTFKSLGLKDVRYRPYRREKVYWEFRKDPVPHTGHSKYRYRRSQKFVSELKALLGYKEYARPGRLQTLKYMSLWDGDDYRSDMYNRYSWKKNKKKRQWM